MSKFEEVKNNIDINLVYDKLSKIEVPLERQQNYNRHYIDQKIVESDQALDLLDKINTQVIQELTNYEIRQSVIEEEIANRKRNELTNNQEILKKYNTGKERESAVELLISDSMAELSKLNRRILALKNLAGIIKTKQSIIIKKMRNIQDQSRMMSELLKANVPLPEDKDTALLMKSFQDIEKLEESLDAEDVGESTEYIEPSQSSEPQQEASEKTDKQDVSTDDSMDIDLSGMGSESDASDIDVQKIPAQSTAGIDTSDFDVSSDVATDSNDSGSESEDTSSDSLDESESSESDSGSESELDMDTVLDGLDTEDSTDEGSDESPLAELDSEPETSNKGNADVLLEDMFSGDDAVVTKEPAKKSGHGEPTSKEKSPAKSQHKESKKVLKEDDATVPGDVSIDNILDDLGNF